MSNQNCCQILGQRRRTVSIAKGVQTQASCLVICHHQKDSSWPREDIKRDSSSLQATTGLTHTEGTVMASNGDSLSLGMTTSEWTLSLDTKTTVACETVLPSNPPEDWHCQAKVCGSAVRRPQ